MRRRRDLWGGISRTGAIFLGISRRSDRRLGEHRGDTWLRTTHIAGSAGFSQPVNMSGMICRSVDEKEEFALPHCGSAGSGYVGTHATTVEPY